jgi:hypothetical protein
MPLAKAMHIESEFSQIKQHVFELQKVVKEQQATIHSLVSKLDAAETRLVQLDGVMLEIGKSRQECG